IKRKHKTQKPPYRFCKSVSTQGKISSCLRLPSSVGPAPTATGKSSPPAQPERYRVPTANCLYSMKPTLLPTAEPIRQIRPPKGPTANAPPAPEQGNARSIAEIPVPAPRPVAASPQVPHPQSPPIPPQLSKP